MPFLAFLQKSIPFGSGKPISEMNPIFGDRLELSEAASIFVKAFSGDKRKWVMKFKTMPVSKTCRSMLVGVIIDSREQGWATQSAPPVLLYYFILCLPVVHPG